MELERVRKCSQCGLGLENQDQVTPSSRSCGIADDVCSSSGRRIRKDATKVSELLEVLGKGGHMKEHVMGTVSTLPRAACEWLLHCSCVWK